MVRDDFHATLIALDAKGIDVQLAPVADMRAKYAKDTGPGDNSIWTTALRMLEACDTRTHVLCAVTAPQTKGATETNVRPMLIERKVKKRS